MPTSALAELGRLNISYPMTFMIQNPQLGKKSFCGVLEFSAEEGVVHIPVWMMNNLFIEEGAEVIIRNMNLQKGKSVKLQPHETAFIDLADPKAILENELRYYSVLHKGDTISIQFAGRDYLIDVVDTKPDD
jgi:ubiquitin fusion degradation protein 1